MEEQNESSSLGINTTPYSISHVINLKNFNDFLGCWGVKQVSSARFVTDDRKRDEYLPLRIVALA
jgi:hypothetical protein